MSDHRSRIGFEIAVFILALGLTMVAATHIQVSAPQPADPEPSPTPAPVIVEDAPSTRAIMSVIGRISIASACPVGEKNVLTAAHVTNPDPTMPVLFALRWSNDLEDEGMLQPEAVSKSSDLALLSTQAPLVHYYHIAKEAPRSGSRLWWLAYDWSDKDHGFARITLTGTVLTVIAGHIIMRDSTPGGSSGSCVLNDRGEVVALVSFGKMEMDGQENAGFISVFGRWNPLPLKTEKK